EFLDAAATAWAMDEIMAGQPTPAQLAGFAVLLRAKGETSAELEGLVATMLARPSPVAVAGRAVDLVGTGGDQAHTANISTASAIGCADARMATVMAEVLAARGDTALVFRGDDGLDELTTTTTSSVWVAAGGDVVTRPVHPNDLGLALSEPGALRGGDRVFNA